MPVLTSSFDGGTSGTTVTAGSGGNSGGASGQFFEVVSIGPGAAVTFDNAHASSGALAAKISTGATSTSAFLRWSTQLGTQAQVWFRFSAYFTASPAAAIRVFLAQGGLNNASVYVNAAGFLEFHDRNDAVIFDTASPIPLGAWFRVEGYVAGAAGTGQVELKFYRAAASAAPDEVITSAATLDTGGTSTNVAYGTSVNRANVAAFWLDDLGVSSAG